MPRTSVGSFINLAPLPGVGEIESGVKGLINRMRASGYERDQCESLVRRVDGLTAVATACNGFEDFDEILSQLQDVKSRFELKLSSQSKLSRILQAQNRLRACDDLNRELTDLMNMAQWRLWASNHRRLLNESTRLNETLIADRAELDKILIEDRVRWDKRFIESVAQPNRRSEAQNFETIRQCDISFDEQESPTLTPSHRILVRERIRQPNRIAIHFRRGRLGKLHVTYTSFSAHQNHAKATERAEEELKHLSRIQHHPNIAAVVGVTRGYDGLNGLVLAMDGITLEKFVQRSVAGGVLARFFKGIMELRNFFFQREILGDDDHFHMGAMTVAPNGHVTVIMLRDEPPDDLPTSDELTDPVMKMAVDIWDEKLDSEESGNYLQSEPMRGFIESLASLGQSHLTQLRLLKIVAECGFDLTRSYHSWYGTVTPSFTQCPGDLGYVIETAYGNETWEVLEAFGGTTTESDTCNSVLSWDHNCRWQRLPRTHSQYRTWISECHCESTQITMEYSKIEKNWMSRARNASKQHSVELRNISHVDSITATIKAPRRGSLNQPINQASLYFHCNPLARSTPRDFWGFFSTNPNPYAPKTGLEDLGGAFEYKINYTTTGDWGRQYEQALRENMVTIPGTYPGAYIEDLSDGESE